MTTERTIVECDVCKAQYTQLSTAEACERSHPRPCDLTVVGAGFARDRANFLYRWQEVPVTLRVKFGSGPTDHATYRLERVGPKAV